ncbi:hypothetical protein BaRGS_00004549 [Batillaria attramentaria]|uniref:Uncharacterized protein n=1 Tax=Batillaria attramentaria TaxID=370345 RepID=A0ABD0LX81_9CAEN
MHVPITLLSGAAQQEKRVPQSMSSDKTHLPQPSLTMPRPGRDTQRSAIRLCKENWRACHHSPEELEVKRSRGDWDTIPLIITALPTSGQQPFLPKYIVFLVISREH